MKKFFLHLRPKKVPQESLNFFKTFGLGGLLTYLFLLEIFTGIFLMYYYIPHPFKAYLSTKKISEILPYGYLFRNIHRFCGEMMIIIGFLHIVRIIYQNAIDNNLRKKNWIIGVLLFLLIFPLNFTGYLLPFDTISYWGATIVLNVIDEIPFIGKFLRLLISGSNGIDNNVLIRFYTYHIIVLSGIFIFLIFIHFYYVRRARGIKVDNFSKMVDAKNLFIKETAFIIITTILILIICSKFYSAPIEDFALTSKIPEIIKAPWYFLNLQYLLKIFPSNFILLLIGIYIFFLIKFPLFPSIKGKVIFMLVHIILILLISLCNLSL